MNKDTKLKPIAVWPICVGLGVLVVEMTDERVVWRWSNEKKLHTSKISKSPKNGKLYIRVNRFRYWLDDAVKIQGENLGFCLIAKDNMCCYNSECSEN